MAGRRPQGGSGTWVATAGAAPVPKTGGLLGEAARLARGEAPGLGQPADRVGEGLPQGAGLDVQLVAGLGVVAMGIAVHDPDAFGTPGQSRPQPTLHEV